MKHESRPMGKIISVEQISKLKNKKKAGKKIVLVGGSFDIIHAGHIEFLNKAKNKGDILVLMLESDARIKELKGEKRPINSQKDRGLVLSNLLMVDYIILLPYFKTDRDYELLVNRIEPDIIALTKGDPILNLKKRYARNVGGKIMKVVERLKNYSTTKILEKI